MPMTLALSVRRRSRACACRASSPSTISAAPAAFATSMKSCPSTFSPLSATKPIPGFTSRLSNVYFIPSPNRESRTASHESRHAALGVAVERDEILDLVDLLDVVLDAVEGLRAVETLAVDEAVGFLERLDGVLGEAAARQSDDVDADDFDAAVDHVAEHVGRKVLADLCRGADHRVSSDGAELMRAGHAADDYPVLEMDVARELNGIGADAVVAENDAVCRMAVAHEKAVVADDRLLAVRGAEVYGRKLADDGAVADFDVADGSVPVLEVLGLHADESIGVDLALRADRGVPVDDGSLADEGSVADLDVLADVRVGADFDVRAELRAVFDDCGGMDHFSFSFNGFSEPATTPARDTRGLAARSGIRDGRRISSPATASG